MVYTDWVLNSTQSVCIYTPPRDREHTPEAAAAFRTVRSECFELSGLGLVTLRLLTIPLPIRVVEENNGLFNLLPVSTTRSTSSACRRRPLRSPTRRTILPWKTLRRARGRATRLASARQEAGPKGLAQPSTMRALPSKRPKLGRP